jgi:carboxymethylenebutenolidase
VTGTISAQAEGKNTLSEGDTMCVDSDSHPPIHPIAGGSVGSQDLRLGSADGTRFMAHAARASKPTGAGMIVIPDVRGLHTYYKELADRFAEIGVDAVAFDFFARTAPSDDRGDSFDFMSQVPLTKPETLQADIAAAGAFLKSAAGGGVRSLFSVGFCFGGALSYLQAASGVGYKGVIAFYGWPLGLSRWPDRPRPIDAVPRYVSPVLSLFGGADPGIPQSAIDEFDAACRKANVKHSQTVYPGAPHSFFDRKYTEFAEASADSWKRVQDFVRANT